MSALLPAMRILTEYLATHHQHSMFASQKVSNLESVGSCGAIFSELSNLICHKPLPVHVSLTTKNNQETVNCIETVDLQGFRPLRESGIGSEWFARTPRTGSCSGLPAGRLGVVSITTEVVSPPTLPAPQPQQRLRPRKPTRPRPRRAPLAPSRARGPRRRHRRV